MGHGHTLSNNVIDFGLIVKRLYPGVVIAAPELWVCHSSRTSSVLH